MPKVSVIIPNYNHANYLHQRIDSVLNQTYQDFEIIILDDCSSDNSRCVIEQYTTNKRISHIIYNETNSGNTFKQWDKGINLATGEYVWIAESDDWCEITLLENLMNGINKDDNCVLAYCQSYCIAGDNKIKFQSQHTQLAEYIQGGDFIKKYILPRNPIFNAGMALWRKDVYYKISKDFINYKLVGDFYFWTEVCRYGNVFICGKLLNYFRNHEKNVSVNSIKNGLVFTELIPFLKRLLDNKVIDKTDYVLSLKRSYSLFRFSKKNMPREHVHTIQKLFSFSSTIQYKLKLYFLEKAFQNFIRRLMRL